MNILRLADMLGTVTATVCVTITLPELAENLGLLTQIGYTFGIVVLTNKLNGITRGEND